MTELLNSFALWGGLTLLLLAWIVVYAMCVEARRHPSQRTAWRTRRHAAARPMVSKAH